MHFCCYLLCFLRGGPSGRPGAGTATRGRVSPLGSCFLNLVSDTMHSLSKPFDSGSSMRHRLPLPHRSLRFHCAVNAVLAAPHGGATPRWNFSLGSAAVGAALSSVLLLRSWLGLERERWASHFSAQGRRILVSGTFWAPRGFRGDSQRSSRARKLTFVAAKYVFWALLGFSKDT